MSDDEDFYEEIVEPKIRPLKPLITEEEIQEAANDLNLHIGEGIGFGQKLDLLLRNRVFGKISWRTEVAPFLYKADGVRPPPGDRSEKGHKNTTYGVRRLRRLCEGRASFIKREAQFFHDAFRSAVGDDLANRISVSDYIKLPVDEIISLIDRSSIPVKQDRMDPVSVLKSIIAYYEESPDIEIQISNQSSLAFSYVGNGHCPDDFEEPGRPIILNIGDPYILSVSPVESFKDCLLFEFSKNPIYSNSKKSWVQAKFLGEGTRRGENIVYGDTANARLKKMAPGGDFGFVAIKFRTNRDLASEFGCSGSQQIPANDFNKMVLTIRNLLSEGADIDIALIEYITPQME